MIKKTLLYFSILFTSIVYTQECNYVKNEIDKFTKKEIKQTKFHTLASKYLGNDIVRVDALEIDNQDFLQCYLVNLNEFTIIKGDKFILLDENNKTTDLVFIDSKTSKPQVHGSDTYWNVIAQFPINDSLKRKLKTSKYVALRYYTQDGYREYKIKKKFQGNLKKILSCI